MWKVDHDDFPGYCYLPRLTFGARRFRSCLMRHGGMCDVPWFAQMKDTDVLGIWLLSDVLVQILMRREFVND